MKKQKWIVMPARGLTADQTTQSVSSASRKVLLEMYSTRTFAINGTAHPDISVVDSIAENGAKLVEMTPEAVMDFKAQSPGLKVLPLVWYKPMVLRADQMIKSKKPSKAAGTISIKVVNESNQPVAGAQIVAFTDFEARLGANGKTDKQGIAKLGFSGAIPKIEMLLIYPQHSCWGLYKKNIQIKDNEVFQLKALNPAQDVDCVRYFYDRAAAPGGDGSGVRVGIIDTGVGPHNDLKVSGGRNTTEEDEKDYFDSGEMHGTHVAGIVASTTRGVAPKAEIYSYRVFRKGEDTASNYPIIKAIYLAIKDGCDLINMSLGGGEPDEATKTAIEDARAKGVLVLVAAGNEGSEVSFPASYQMSMAVAAMGRKGAYPSSSTEIGDEGKVSIKDSKNFFAGFSNRGMEIDLIGPGVGVISTVPDDRWGVMSGTSMACPAVTAMAARLLSADQSIKQMPKDEARSDAIAKLLFDSAVILGFGPEFEGHGMPGAKHAVHPEQSKLAANVTS
jgi:subtilisin family serine protease